MNVHSKGQYIFIEELLRIYAGGLLYQHASNFSAHTSHLQQINLLIMHSYCNKENCPNKMRHKEYLTKVNMF